jgi:hypothetical protein
MSVTPLRVLETDKKFVRPYRAGLLPGRVLKVPSRRSEVEYLLRLESGALLNEIIQVDWPQGYWRYNDSCHCVSWLGTRTDSVAPLSSPPQTYLPLIESIEQLSDLLLLEARVLGEGGWSKMMPFEGVKNRILSERILGVSGIFGVSDKDTWEVELYTNGMLWAETPARMGIICARLSLIVEAGQQK